MLLNVSQIVGVDILLLLRLTLFVCNNIITKVSSVNNVALLNLSKYLWREVSIKRVAIMSTVCW